MNYRYASFSDVGKRENNEDFLGVARTGDALLAVVADGLGGYANGEVASRLAVETLLKTMPGREWDEDELAYGILDANKAVCTAEISGSTTITALWLWENGGIAAHVGDSRIYQFRDGKILFQSVDHSMVQMAVRMGELEPDAVRTHKNRNQLFRVLGDREEEPKIDSTELTVKPGDRFLLCSDGFWEPVTEEDMCRTAMETDSAESWLEAMKEIVRRARDPRQDNFTAVVIFAK